MRILTTSPSGSQVIGMSWNVKTAAEGRTSCLESEHRCSLSRDGLRVMNDAVDAFLDVGHLPQYVADFLLIQLHTNKIRVLRTVAWISDRSDF